MDFWNILDRVSSFLGILTVFLSSYSAYRLWRQNQRHLELAKQGRRSINIQQLIRDYEGKNTTNPVAFALALTPNNPSIKNDVEIFLRSQGWHMPVEEFNMSGINNANDIQTFVEELQERKRFFQLQGYTEMHLFINGPVQAGTIIGALFDNWLPIKLYHKPSPPPPEIYEYWMPLIGS